MKPAPPLYSERYKRIVTLLLMSAYTCNAMDRNIISIISQSMKVDLKLTDAQLGLLGGTAFAMLYAFGGIPIARLAERFNRVNIMTAALMAWSALTALCGAAMTFSQLFLIRAGVGVAESGCSPPAHSLISDYFEASRRTSALSIYSCGTSLGYLLAAVVGGYVAQHWGWRTACSLVGLPGIAVAVLLKVCVREPRRGMSERFAAGGVAAPSMLPRAILKSSFSIRAEWRELRTVAGALLFDRPVAHMVLGVTIGGFAAYGLYAFVPAHFSRSFELDYTTIGVIAGLAGGVAVGMGIVAGGFLADFLAARNARWYALVPAIGSLIAIPLYFSAVLQSSWRWAGCLLAVAGFFQYASLGPTFGVVQNVVDQRRRATATALLYICLNVIALGGGPLFTGWVIDRFAEMHFHHAGYQTLYAHSCPGGAGLPSAEVAMNLACHSTLRLATRQGLLVTLLFFGWASLHYFLASRGIAKALQGAALASSVQSDSI